VSGHFGCYPKKLKDNEVFGACFFRRAFVAVAFEKMDCFARARNDEVELVD